MQQLLNDGSVTQEEINLAYTELDETLKKLKRGNDTTSSGGNSGSNSGESTAPMHKPYIKGYTDNSVRPNHYITRAEMITLIAKLQKQSLY